RKLQILARSARSLPVPTGLLAAALELLTARKVGVERALDVAGQRPCGHGLVSDRFRPDRSRPDRSRPDRTGPGR
ncbi:hypothetical protein, partial [Frankia sp. CiP3]|uniref:hypothetical protein n=1 Tax=Frankia sp. CiP3 TaxID=2880971 RepID=UPI0035AF541B